MVNDLVNVENIHNDLCIYEIEYESLDYELQFLPNGRIENRPKKGKPKWFVHKTFYNLKDTYKSVLKTEYRFFIDRQSEISHRYRIDINMIILLLNRLSAHKQIPLSLQPRKDIVRQCKARRGTLGKIYADQIHTYKSVVLYCHTFRAQLISYLIQKREDICDTLSLGQDDREIYDKMLQVFIEMDTATKNYITFNQAVDNLYEKAIRELTR